MSISEWDTQTLLALATRVLESTFVMSAIGALAGAFGGAWAAQRIAERAKERDQLLQEVKSSNTAIELAHEICSAFLNAKEQYTAPVRTRFEQQRRAVREHIAQRDQGKIPATQRIDISAVDLRVFPPLGARVEQLQEVVLERISVSGRPRPLVKTLARSIEQFDHLLQVRNEHIPHVKGLLQTNERDEAFVFMFGLPRDGGVDSTYGDVIKGLDEATDDCIFFSTLLIADLGNHGKRAQRKFKSRFRGSIPNIHKLDWKAPREKGLMPDGEKYDSWKTGFKTRVPKTEGRRLSKWRFMFRKELRSPSFMPVAGITLFVIATAILVTFFGA